MVTVESHQTSQHNVNYTDAREYSTINNIIVQVSPTKNGTPIDEYVIMGNTLTEPMQNETNKNDKNNSKENSTDKSKDDEEEWQVIKPTSSKSYLSNTIDELTK